MNPQSEKKMENIIFEPRWRSISVKNACYWSARATSSCKCGSSPGQVHTGLVNFAFFLPSLNIFTVTPGCSVVKEPSKDALNMLSCFVLVRLLRNRYYYVHFRGSEKLSYLPQIPQLKIGSTKFAPTSFCHQPVWQETFRYSITPICGIETWVSMETWNLMLSHFLLSQNPLLKITRLNDCNQVIRQSSVWGF